MYAALWHVLPGPWWVRVLILVILVAAVLFGLFYYVFPWVEPARQPAGSHVDWLRAAMTRVARRRQPRQLRAHPRRLSPRARRRDRPRRNDDVDRDGCRGIAIARLSTRVLVSPGPGKPADAGASIAVVRAARGSRHPAARRVPRPPGDRRGVRRDRRRNAGAHARHDLARRARRQRALRRAAAARSRPRATTRSRSCDGTLPDELVVTSRTEGGVIMGIAHARRRSTACSSTPSRVLTEGGHRLLGNWLETVGFAGCRGPRRRTDPLQLASRDARHVRRAGQGPEQ